jgi:GST-like protein
MLEELLAPGHAGAEYDAWLINIGEGDQFGSGFVEVNPELQDPGADGSFHRPEPTRSVRIRLDPDLSRRKIRRLPAEGPLSADRGDELAVLADGLGALPRRRLRPLLCLCAREVSKYAIDRYAMEVKRQLDVLDRHLADNEYMAGKEYSIADMAIWPWYGALVTGAVYDAGEFLQVQEYKNVIRWMKQVGARPGVKRGQHGQSHLRRAGIPAARAP